MQGTRKGRRLTSLTQWGHLIGSVIYVHCDTWMDPWLMGRSSHGQTEQWADGDSNGWMETVMDGRRGWTETVINKGCDGWRLGQGEDCDGQLVTMMNGCSDSGLEAGVDEGRLMKMETVLGGSGSEWVRLWWDIEAFLGRWGDSRCDAVTTFLGCEAGQMSSLLWTELWSLCGRRYRGSLSSCIFVGMTSIKRHKQFAHTQLGK